ncbi:MAG TPA: hypothetical protein VLA52_01060 [Thermohalobaculum sp.]|nr:hypothetical protein [Thermohalobaculum sp.]
MPKPGDTLRTLALAVAVCSVFVVVATPLCIVIGGVDGCEAFACEVMAMRRPMADYSWCEAFFDFFR